MEDTFMPRQAKVSIIPQAMASIGISGRHKGLDVEV
jgi:hypothetical protein